jgi:hypothetical protein
MAKKKFQKPELEFKIHAPQFLTELFNNNPLGGVFYVPCNTLRMYLTQIATRASELNDPKLNAIMCQMALYEIADPHSTEYDGDRVMKIIKAKYDTIPSAHEEKEEFGRQAFYDGRQVKTITDRGVVFKRPTYERYLRELRDNEREGN